MMNGILTIMKVAEQFHYQRTGNAGEWKKYALSAPKDTALAFTYYDPFIDTIDQFEARKCDNITSTNDPDVIDIIDLLASDPITITDNGYLQQTATNESTNLEIGIYYYYFKAGSKEFKSELFCITGDIARVDLLLDDNGQPILDELNVYIYQLI
jgi:hypothetical protein